MVSEPETARSLRNLAREMQVQVLIASDDTAGTIHPFQSMQWRLIYRPSERRQVRAWDELAKVENKPLPDLERYKKMAKDHLRNKLEA